MAKTIGIDLGTTNSCMSVLEGGEPTVIENAEGGRTTPSVVAFTDSGERLVGTVAKRQAVTNPTNTIFSIKRFMGRKEAEVKEEESIVPYKVVAGPGGDAQVEARGEQYSPPEISAMILQKLKADAEAYLGDTVDSAVIIGFNVKPAERVAELAEREGVDLRFYSVIYAAIEDIEAALKGMLKPEYEEVQLGTAEVREVFKSSKFGNVAGSLIRSGEIKRGTKARILRAGVVVGEGIEITGLRRFKDDVTEVREGFECGINLGSFNDIRVDDIIETHEMREIPRA
jgi:hypothetical protein